jgi:hypothetical protein
MLDNTENQRLHERIVEVASFIPGFAADSTSFPHDCAGQTESVPFSKSKIDRILERVYDRIADEASDSVHSRLREMLGDALAHARTAHAYSEGKLQRILARVQAQLDADKATAPLPSAEPVKRPARRSSPLAGLRPAASALFLLRHLSFEARLLSDPPAPRPLTDGPID